MTLKKRMITDKDRMGVGVGRISWHGSWAMKKMDADDAEEGDRRR
jgi:hypothetical protein